MQDRSPTVTYNKPKYFYSLDVLRGLAALSIVLWHWQSFYSYKTVFSPTFNPERQPLYHIFFVFYNNGALAVDFFFVLSGFVFFYLYAEKISQRLVNGKTFFVLRFSRLYPLHFITLLLVLALQQLSVQNTGGFFTYPYNDTYHFILNLFFAQSWGLEKGYSFNAPSWSVSVEVLLYLVFFLLCWFKLHKRFLLVVVMVAGAVLISVYAPLGRGIFCFFIGGVVCGIYLQLLKSRHIKKYTYAFGLLFITLFIFTMMESRFSFMEHIASQWHIKAITPARLTSCYNYVLRLVVFPSVILLLVLAETIKGTLGRRIAVIGHISYSSYLLHFPLQLVLINWVYARRINVYAFFDSPLTLAGYYVVLIAISLASFYLLELPLQKRIRQFFLRRVKVVK